MLRAGQHPSSWAEEATAVLDAQYLAHERDERGLGGRVKAEIEEHVACWARRDPWLAEHPPAVRWTVDADCAEIPVDHPFLGLLRETSRAAGLSGELAGTGAHTDSSLLIEAEIPTVVFGPAELEQAHQADESVAVDDLVAVTAAMALAMAAWGRWRAEPG
jgi:acetylornithine deacetylase